MKIPISIYWPNYYPFDINDDNASDDYKPCNLQPWGVGVCIIIIISFFIIEN